VSSTEALAGASVPENPAEPLAGTLAEAFLSAAEADELDAPILCGLREYASAEAVRGAGEGGLGDPVVCEVRLDEDWLDEDWLDDDWLDDDWLDEGWLDEGWLDEEPTAVVWVDAEAAVGEPDPARTLPGGGFGGPVRAESP
jgi:hypothetical protein